MTKFHITKGPMTGEKLPFYGGSPDRTGCRGCTDCCHLEISVTHEKSLRLKELYQEIKEPQGVLEFQEDPENEGWKIMNAPCVFRRPNKPLQEGGCQIYEDRPAFCAVFTCEFLLTLRREHS